MLNLIKSQTAKLPTPDECRPIQEAASRTICKPDSIGAINPDKG